MGSVGKIDKLKPVLRKIFPASVLQYGKRQLVGQWTRRIAHVHIQPYDSDAFPYGLNLIGPIDGATGLGQSCRLVEHVIRQTGCPYMIYNYEQNTKNKVSMEDYLEKTGTQLQYSINLWHVNPSEFAEAYMTMGSSAFDKKYNIAFWLWELEEFPEEWVPYIRLLDEIWTPSEFVSRSIRQKTSKPVYTVPYCVTAESDVGRYGRKYFSLPEDRFLFLMMYDSQSIKERKNPEGAIRAFQSAFASEQNDVGLVVKVNSADEKELSWLKNLSGDYKNIYLIDRNLEKIQVNSLVSCVDVFVSLHRAEGFGLVMAEAMLNRVPVIATAWSANTEFMNPQVACMVGYQLETLEKDMPPYKKGNRWAEPDLEEAAGYMRRLYAEKEYYAQISENAYAHAKEWLGMNRIKSVIQERLQDIRDGKR